MNEHVEQSPDKPEDWVANRREFLNTGATLTAATVAALIVPTHSCRMSLEHSGHDAHESSAHPDMEALLREEMGQDFHHDPIAYLNAHPEIEQRCFRPSPVRMLRVPGSGILKDPEKWVATLVAYVKDLEQQNGVKPVTLKLFAHKTCGAAGMKYGEDQPDKKAENAIQQTVRMLREASIDAEFGGFSPMNDLHVHSALGVTVDCTDGRMQETPFNSFAVSSPDAEGVPGEVALGATISTKPREEGGHSYGNLLREKRATYVVLGYLDPDRPRESEVLLKKIEQGLRPFRQRNVPVRLIQRNAPKDTQSMPVTEVQVHCIDERCKPNLP